MSDLPRVYLTRRLPRPALDLLGQHARVVIWPGDQPPPRAVLMKEIAEADGVIAQPADRMDAAMLDAAPRLRAISNYAAGYDNIDLGAATERGVFVTNTPGVLTETVADFTLALTLAAARRIVDAEQYLKAGRGRLGGMEALLGRDLQGATLGIIGLGQIGRAVARRARGFGMRLLYANPSRKSEAERELGLAYAPLEQLLSDSDVISLHCPLNDETYHLLDRDALELLKPEAILVNTARGQLIDTRALVDLLRRKPIIGALDATDPNPLPDDHPLLMLPNALVTPHVGGATVRARTRMAVVAVENLLAALAGERPQYLVNDELWPENAISVGQG